VYVCVCAFTDAMCGELSLAYMPQVPLIVRHILPSVICDISDKGFSLYAHY